MPSKIIGTGRQDFALDIDLIAVDSAAEVSLPSKNPVFVAKRVAGMTGERQVRKWGEYEIGDASIRIETLKDIEDVLFDAGTHIITTYTREQIMNANTRLPTWVQVKNVMQVQFGEFTQGTLNMDSIDAYESSLIISGMEIYYAGVEKFYYYPELKICRVNGVDEVPPVK